MACPNKFCPVHAPRLEGSGVTVHAIDAGLSWVRVECERWACTGTQLVYLRTPVRTTLLRFTQFDASRVGMPRRYVLAVLTAHLGFDAAGGRLNVLRVYRGIGDCGQWLSYKTGSPVPRLVGLRVRECPLTRGEPPPPKQWPLRRP